MSFLLIITFKMNRKIFARIFSSGSVLLRHKLASRLLIRIKLSYFNFSQHIRREKCSNSAAKIVRFSFLSRYKHGIFMRFCKHDDCLYGTESNLRQLKLVVAISNFISKWEMWI